ncbi:hypothetical protein V5F79_22075 [Xanthobacter flavus]|uniref:phage baseplate plug family protein n=1 Tax=Xanthobacter flavus TaxID=281 RepID=UPI00372809D2
MATVYEIPVKAGAGNQTLSIDLAGKTYRLSLAWRNAKDAGWTLDIADADRNPLVNGVPLVTGADLLAPYRHLGFSGSLFVTTDGAPDVPPGFAELGRTAHLYWVPAA